MTDLKFVPLEDMENRLGEALAIAIAMIRDQSLINNKNMAQVETVFREWCDGIVDGGQIND